MSLLQLILDIIFSRRAAITPVEKGINLSGFIENTHFTWAEALKNGDMYATPTEEQKANIIKQAHLLEGVRTILGPMQVTSWLRTVEHNKAVGGASKSTHLCGAATDFVPALHSIEEAKRLITESKCYPGGSEINSTTWIHLDFIHTKDFIA